MNPHEQREPLTVTVAHMIAAIIGTAVAVLILGIVALARVGAL